MTDDMRFRPDPIEVREGETVRFVIRNCGKLMHEFGLGTKAELDQHAEVMKKLRDMEHDEPYPAIQSQYKFYFHYFLSHAGTGWLYCFAYNVKKNGAP